MILLRLFTQIFIWFTFLRNDHNLKRFHSLKFDIKVTHLYLKLQMVPSLTLSFKVKLGVVTHTINFTLNALIFACKYYKISMFTTLNRTKNVL